VDDGAPKVKICGITSLADAELAVERGAWALGLNFLRGQSAPLLGLEAERIGAALRREVEVCGVFVNATLEQVIATSENLGLSLLQLHGDEGPRIALRPRGVRRTRDQGGAGVGARRRSRARALPRRLSPARRAAAARRRTRRFAAAPARSSTGTSYADAATACR